ncbi:sugar ABC transporter substrate-binding protein [Anaerobacillus sp. CMMVII]|uniref:ABC transporter substrate-binding protein n=1 Tax=Anaerobacillus sp. CMMVII TaxID=2755588 RepID=UPI0021B75C51|nr:sugar ABC transporter substrate-binding protein [Anaerobacillus sp. CMMVII]MCT8137037.1 sugar ABC transporter substrate-binding protein [Anaerobacillus sp. CMMVII]
MKNHFWKLFSVLVLAFLILLTGCSSSDSSKDSDQITLRIGTWEGGDAFQIQQRLAEEYMDKNPNIKIEVESVPDGYGQRILTQVASGVAPDIFQIGEDDIRTYADRGAIIDLTTFTNSDSEFSEADYIDTVLNIGRIDGKLFTLPKDFSNIAVYYNKRLFDEAGIPHPEVGWTWEEFYEIAKKLTVKDGNRITQWGVQLPGTDLTRILPLIYAYGGDLISQDGTQFEGYLNSEGTATALQMYYDMYFKDSIAPTDVDREAFAGVNLFGSEIVAMSVHGRWPAAGYIDNPNLEFGTVALPEGPAGAGNSIAYAGYGIYSQSKNQAAAWDYLKYLAGKEGTSQFAEHAFVAVQSVAEESGQLTKPVYQGFTDGNEHIRPKPSLLTPHFAQSGAVVIKELLEKITLGYEMDINQELDRLAKEADELLKQAQDK